MDSSFYSDETSSPQSIPTEVRYNRKIASFSDIVNCNPNRFSGSAFMDGCVTHPDSVLHLSAITMLPYLIYSAFNYDDSHTYTRFPESMMGFAQNYIHQLAGKGFDIEWFNTRIIDEFNKQHPDFDPVEWWKKRVVK